MNLGLPGENAHEVFLEAWAYGFVASAYRGCAVGCQLANDGLAYRLRGAHHHTDDAVLGLGQISSLLKPLCSQSLTSFPFHQPARELISSLVFINSVDGTLGVLWLSMRLQDILLLMGWMSCGIETCWNFP